MIHKETVKSMETGPIGSIAMAACIFVSLVAIVGFNNLIYARFGIPYISYAVFILYVLIGVYIYRKKLREYRYSVIDDELIFEQIVGTRIKPIVSVKLSHVRYFCSLSHENKSNIKHDHNYLLLFKKNSPNAYVLSVKQGKKNIRIVFEPSKELVDIIKKA